LTWETSARVVAAALFLIPIGRAVKHLRGKVPRIVPVVSLVIHGAACAGILVGAFTNQREHWTADGGRTIARLSASEWPLPGADDSPVIVLAASGGGSRAAYFTARVLEGLHTFVDADSKTRELDLNIHAISSVS